jgi:hypothetical protein
MAHTRRIRHVTCHTPLWGVTDVTARRWAGNVRFRGNCGPEADVTRCPLLTQSGHRAAIRASLNSAREPRARQ